MEIFDFQRFSENFMKFLSENKGTLEEFADLVEAGTRRLFINVVKSDFRLGSGLSVPCSMALDFKIGDRILISSCEESFIQILSQIRENQVIITYQDSFILYEGPCSTPSCKVQVQSCQISDGDIYSIGNSTLTIKFIQSEASSILLIYIKCPGFETKCKLESSGTSKILYNNNKYDSIKLGRNSLNSSIKISDPIISREHIEIKFSSNWYLSSISSTQDTFKFLHSAKSLDSKEYSSPFYIDEASRFYFMQTQFLLQPL